MDVKQPTTYSDQIDKLRSHGCIIDNEQKCILFLESVGYYRLSGYALSLKDNFGDFISGTTFSNIVSLYEFDSNIRSVFSACIEEIEVSLRSRFSYYFAHKYGPLGYQNPDNFSKYHDHVTFTSKYISEINSNRKVLFVKHHLDKYNGNFPLWVLMEIFTFGMLSYFYADLKTEDKKFLSSTIYDIPFGKMASYLRCCTDLRNICSHYGRLYFRVFSATPQLNGFTDSEKTRLWGYINLLKALYPFADKWNQIVLPRIINIFNLYADDIDLHHIAFPANWKSLLVK